MGVAWPSVMEGALEDGLHIHVRAETWWGIWADLRG